MKYEAKEISPLNLYLDTKNPRFIVKSNATQEDTIEYLLKYEEIAELAKGINKNEGLLLGERIIVCKEDDKYVVLEGNRRTCSCKLLLNSDLIPEPYKSNFIKISEKTRNNIETIQVDVAPTRLEAQLALSSKHIDGIRKWSTISKMKFYKGSIDEGKDINFVSEVTGIKKHKIVKGIKDYNLLTYALNLKNNMTIKYYDLIDIQTAKLDPFFRIFSTSSKKIDNKSTRDLLKITFNDVNYKFCTLLPKEIFDNCIGILIEKTLMEVSINTRNTIDDVDEVISILQLYYKDADVSNANVEISNPPNITSDENRNIINSTNENVPINNTPVIKNEDSYRFNESSKSLHKNTDNPQELNEVPKKNDYAKINNRNYILPDHFNYKTSSTKINQMIVELHTLKVDSFPIACSVLLRCFFEQLSKCYADKNKIKYDSNTALYTLINDCSTHLKNSNLISKEVHSNINSVTKNPNKSYISILHGITHQPESYPSKDVIIEIFNVLEEYCHQILLNINIII